MNSEQIGTSFILVGLIIYGVHPVVVEVGGLYLAPLFFASVTTTFAGLAVTPVALRSRKAQSTGARRTDYLRLVFTGVFGTFLAFTCLFLGLQLTSSNNAAVILRSELAFALLFGYLFLHEAISPRQAAVMLLMVCGVLLVVLTTQTIVLGLGDLLLLVTPAAWAAGHTFAKPTLTRVSPWVVVAFRNLVGGGLLLSVTFWLVLPNNPLILTSNIPLVIGIVFVETIVILLAHNLWYLGIRRINLGKATALIAPAPLVTFLLSTLILRIAPTLWQIAGATLVIIATLLLSREPSLQRLEKV
ncbi:MAG: DMT family transporter [Promethearchaeota archaeon]